MTLRRRSLVLAAAAVTIVNSLAPMRATAADADPRLTAAITAGNGTRAVTGVSALELAARLAALSAVEASPTTAPTAAAENDPRLVATVAERLARAADVAAPDLATAPEPSLRAAAALLDLARGLRPDEVRFARASADVLLQLGERERAIAALVAVRALEPKDQLAQIQFVDLTLAGMETAEARQAYAQQVANAPSVAPEVRSHAAMQLMQSLVQRAQDGQALAALDQALTLNPQNATALEMKYRTVAGNGNAKPADRVRALARLIEVSPGDARHLVTLAQECMAAGDTDGAWACYELAFRLLDNDGQGPPPADDVVDAVGAEMIAGAVEQAARTTNRARLTWPAEGRPYALGLLLSQLAGKSSADLKADVEAARGVYLANLAGMSRLIREPTSTDWPATRPAVPIPDVAADAAALAADDPYQLATAYAVALGDSCWFDAYFEAATLDDARLAALRSLLGDADPLVVRLEGWRLLNAGSVEEAKVKFSAIADRDGFAKLGLAAAAHAQGDAQTAQRLTAEILSARPTGLFAAHAAVAAARTGIKPTPSKDVAPEVTAAAAQSRELAINAAVAPRDAYLLTAEPLKVSHDLGEPILVKLTILNVGPRPIAIGPRGLIRPAFTVDVQTRGGSAKSFPATLVGRWAGPVRLMSRQSTSQVVRIDRGALDALLRAQPTPLIAMSGFVTSNPVPGPRGSAAGTGGQQAELGNVFERRAAPVQLDAYLDRMNEAYKSGAPADRLAVAELVATITPAASNDAAGQAKAAQMLATLRAEATQDADPTVRAWKSAYAAAGDAAALSQVAAGQGEAGQVAALAVAITSGADRAAVASAVAGASPSATVAELARAVAAMPVAPPATRPAQ